MVVLHTKEHPGDQTLESVSRRLADIPEEDMLQTIANILYTLAQMEYLPPRRTMERLEHLHRAMRRARRATRRFRMSRAAPPRNLLWAMSSLRYRPGEEFFAAFNEQCVPLRRVHRPGRLQHNVRVANLDSNPGRPFWTRSPPPLNSDAGVHGAGRGEQRVGVGGADYWLTRS